MHMCKNTSPNPSILVRVPTLSSTPMLLALMRAVLSKDKVAIIDTPLTYIPCHICSMAILEETLVAPQDLLRQINRAW